MRRDTAQLALHLKAKATCARVNGTSAVLAYPTHRTDRLWLADLSHLPRFGLKGPAAVDALHSHGLPIPEQPNSWAPLDAQSWSLIARLGRTEFLLEMDGDATRMDLLGKQLQAQLPGVYPVLREDSEFVLGGELATDALKEVCNVDFSSIEAGECAVIITMMAGVAVLVIPQFEGVQRLYRIWCDPSFGAYLWTTLQDVIAHHSGVILGLEQLASPPRLPPATERLALGEDA